MISTTRPVRDQKAQKRRIGRPPNVPAPKRIADSRRPLLPRCRQESHQQRHDEETRSFPPLAPKVGGMGVHEQEPLDMYPATSWHYSHPTPTVAPSEPMFAPELQHTNRDRRFEQVALKPPVQPRRSDVQLPRGPRPQKPDDQEKRTFACPYYKSDAETYQACRRYKLSRFRDVMQHIRRIHVVSLFCTRCHAVFDSLPSLEAHERSTQYCNVRPRAGIISRHHLDMFGERIKEHNSSSERDKTGEDQWIDLWDLLFPGVDHPASVYLESHEEEMASKLMSFWTDHCNEITSQAMAREIAEDKAVAVRVFDMFLRHLLEQFQNDGRKSHPNSARATSESAPHHPTSAEFENILTEGCTSISSESVTEGTVSSVESQSSWMWPEHINHFSLDNNDSDTTGQDCLLYRDFTPSGLSIFDPVWTPTMAASMNGQELLLPGDDPPTTLPFSPRLSDIIDLTGPD